MLVLNEHGLEVEVDHETIEHLKKRGVWQLYRTSPRQTLGCGPEKSICLLLQRNGIGDAIHALPAISQKIKDGYSITVVAEPFVQEWFVRAGCTFQPAQEMMVGFIQENKHKYSKFYSLSQWCIDHDEVSNGSPTVARFQQFADLIETVLPAAFEWESILKPERTTKTNVALGLQSSSNHRSFLQAVELRRELKALGLSTLEIGNGRGKRCASTLQELVNWIHSAEIIIAVDSGVLAIALALQKPVIALFGPTSEEIIVHQFNKYQLLDLPVLRSTTEDSCKDSCKRPCNFQRVKGYGIDGKCKKQGYSDCMKEISVQEIIQEVRKKLKNKCLPSNGLQ